MRGDIVHPKGISRFPSGVWSTIAAIAVLLGLGFVLGRFSFQRQPTFLGLTIAAILLLTLLYVIVLREILFRRRNTASLIQERTAELAESEQRYHGLFTQSREGLILYDYHGRVVDINEAAADMLGYDIEEAKQLAFRNLVSESWYRYDLEQVRNKVIPRGFSDFDEREYIRKDGTVFPANVRVWALKDAEGAITGFSSWIQDITDQKRLEELIRSNQMRIESVLRIAQHRSESLQDLLDFALHECLDLTGSAIGYLYHYDESSQTFTLNTWSKQVMQICSILEKKTTYELDQTGIWGEAVRQRGPVLLNDFPAAHPLKKGFPEGHAPLRRFLTVPVFYQEKIVAVAGVANKQDPYDENDVRQLTLFMHSVWHVAERKRTEEALLRSETRYRSLFENSTAVMLLIDPQNATVVDANTAASHYYGYPLEKLRGMLITEINTLSRDEILQEMQHSQAQERNHFFFSHRMANGEVHPVEVFSGPIEVDGKHLLYSIIHDITARRQAEEAVREDQRRLERILNDLPLATAYSDDSGTIVFSNRTFHDLFGYTRNEIPTIEAWLTRAYPNPENRDNALARWDTDIARARAQNPRIGPSEYLITSKDGHRHTCEITGTLLDQGVLAVFNDITERKLAEEALRRSEKRIRVQFKSIPVPTLIWKEQDGALLLSDYNDAALSFTKGTVARLIGKTDSEIYEDLPQVVSDLRRCLIEHIMIENHLWYDLKDLSEKKYIAVKYAFVAPDLVLMHISDVTLQKQAEEHLHYISIHDSLTGLYNRFYADAEIDRLMTSRKFPVSVIMVDLDGLKTVNDQEGHAAGDLYIKAAVSVLKQSFRPDDMIARIGGDEFLIILPSVDEAVCEQSLARLQANMEIANASEVGRNVKFSMGAATAHSGKELKDCITLSDQRMYQEKAFKKGPRG